MKRHFTVGMPNNWNDIWSKPTIKNYNKDTLILGTERLADCECHDCHEECTLECFCVENDIDKTP